MWSLSDTPHSHTLGARRAEETALDRWKSKIALIRSQVPGHLMLACAIAAVNVVILAVALVALDLPQFGPATKSLGPLAVQWSDPLLFLLAPLAAALGAHAVTLMWHAPAGSILQRLQRRRRLA